MPASRYSSMSGALAAAEAPAISEACGRFLRACRNLLAGMRGFGAQSGHLPNAVDDIGDTACEILAETAKLVARRVVEILRALHEIIAPLRSLLRIEKIPGREGRARQAESLDQAKCHRRISIEF